MGTGYASNLPLGQAVPVQRQVARLPRLRSRNALQNPGNGSFKCMDTAFPGPFGRFLFPFAGQPASQFGVVNQPFQIVKQSVFVPITHQTIDFVPTIVGIAAVVDGDEGRTALHGFRPGREAASYVDELKNMGLVVVVAQFCIVFWRENSEPTGTGQMPQLGRGGPFAWRTKKKDRNDRVIALDLE